MSVIEIKFNILSGFRNAGIQYLIVIFLHYDLMYFEMLHHVGLS